MAAKGSAIIEKQIAALRKLNGRKIEAGWFESTRYDTAPGEDGGGRSVAANARLQNFGGTIDHPGGTKYIKDAVVKGEFVGTRFVKNDFIGLHDTTAAHQIVIPARPFMQLAWVNFSKQQSSVTGKIAKKLASGEITPEQGLQQIADVLANCIKKAIKNGGWQPNSASTIKKKGFDKPLIDKSIMLQSVVGKVI